MAAILEFVLLLLASLSRSSALEATSGSVAAKCSSCLTLALWCQAGSHQAGLTWEQFGWKWLCTAVEHDSVVKRWLEGFFGKFFFRGFTPSVHELRAQLSRQHLDIKPTEHQKKITNQSFIRDQNSSLTYEVTGQNPAVMAGSAVCHWYGQPSSPHGWKLKFDTFTCVPTRWVSNTWIICGHILNLVTKMSSCFHPEKLVSQISRESRSLSSSFMILSLNSDSTGRKKKRLFLFCL